MTELLAAPAPPSRVLEYRRRRRPATGTRWTVTASGSDGFVAVDATGRRATGLARSAAAVPEILAALNEPDGCPPVRWTSAPLPDTDGRLNIYDQPPLGAISDFVAGSHTPRERLRAALPEVIARWQGTDPDAEIVRRAAELDRIRPVLDSGIITLFPNDGWRGNVNLGGLREYAWVELDKVVGGGVEHWNDFSDHRPDTVPWIVRHVLGADDPERAVLEAQCDDNVHRWTDMVRVPGPAGPIYVVGNGRHRTHAMRILGVPVMAAEITVKPLPVLVEQDQLHEPQDPDYPAEAIWRGLSDHGLLDGDVVRGTHGTALQPYRVAAPWLLLSPRRALICTMAYQQVYPGALGVPEDAFVSVEAWVRWCVS